MELFYNELAAKIIDGLDKLDHKFEKGAAERWIWELLQNAKDCTASGQKSVNVEINIGDDKVEFKHSGKPFTIHDIQRLAHQTSQKERSEIKQGDQDEEEEDKCTETGEEYTFKQGDNEQVKQVIIDSMIDGTSPETTGKFGTGFLTTHLLSRIVEIQGIYVNVDDNNLYHQFNLTLDRTPRAKAQMIINYKEIYEKLQNFDNPDLCPLVPNYQAGLACDTNFKYRLDAKGRKTTERGLANFYQCVSHVLAFNSKFESITVKDNRTNMETHTSIFKVLERIELDKDIVMMRVQNGYKKEVQNIIVASENRNLQICIHVDDKNKILQKDPKSPTLYADFPLIGSHEFPYPCVINSHIFWPDEERSSVILQYSSQADINQRLLVRTTLIFHKLLNYLSSSQLPKYKGLQKVCLVGGILPRDVDQQWYKEKVLMSTIKTVCSLPIIKTMDGLKKKIPDVIMPECEFILNYQDKLQDFINILQPVHGLKGNLIAGKIDYIAKWSRCVADSNWKSTLKGINKAWELQNLYSVLKYVISHKDAVAIRKTMPQQNPKSLFVFLNLLYSFIEGYSTAQDRKQIFQSSAIFLNQNDNFCLGSDLKIDSGVETHYKVLYLKFEYDLRKDFVHTDLKKASLFITMSMSPTEIQQKLLTALKAQEEELQFEIKQSKQINQQYLQVQNKQDQKRLALEMIKFMPIIKVINAPEMQDNKEEVEEYNFQQKKIKETQKLKDKKMIFLNWSNKFTDFSATQQWMVEVEEELENEIYEVDHFSNEISKQSEFILLKIVRDQIILASTWKKFMLKIAVKGKLETLLQQWLVTFYYIYIEFRSENQKVQSELLLEPIMLDQNHNFSKHKIQKMDLKGNIIKDEYVSAIAMLSLDLISSDEHLAEEKIENANNFKDLYQKLKTISAQENEIVEDLKRGLLAPWLNEVFKNINVGKLEVKNICKNIDDMIFHNFKKVPKFAKDNNELIMQIEHISNKSFADPAMSEKFLPQYNYNKKDLLVESFTGEFNEVLYKIQQSGNQDLLEDVASMSKEDSSSAKDFFKCIKGKNRKSEMIKNLINDPEAEEQYHKFLEEQKNKPPQEEEKKDIPLIIPIFDLPEEISQDPQNFLIKNLIVNKEQLIDFSKNQPNGNFSEVFGDQFKQSNFKNFQHVMKLLIRALENVRIHLESHPNYDISGWNVDPRAVNKNVINGVLMNGLPVVLLIRPADGGLIKFNQSFEKEVLAMDNGQLWGNSPSTTKRISFGDVLLWNNISEISVKMFYNEC